MKVFPIDDPVVGEQILTVQPAIAPYPDADWRQRLQYFTGRALTHSALRLEQQWRAGHAATLGQAFSPGVVSGLEAVAAQSPAGVVIEIAAGTGLAASGEIVSVNRNQQVLLDDIRVYAPVAMLAAADDSQPVEGAWKLGDTLATLRAQGCPLPEAMVLVLQPVAVEQFSEQASSDPCEYDPTDAAFENWQLLDGCRPVLHVWPAELGPVPAAGSWRRNRIAHAVFEFERHLGEGGYPPWCHVGVPIGLLGFSAGIVFDFLDRHGVVRRGGESKGGGVPVSPAGDRFLWQARFEQFNEQLAEWLSADPGLDPAKMRAETQFRHLPPVGVLPAESVVPRSQLQHFFPLGYSVRALVSPYEQLDLAIAESASLLPYDLNTPDQVELLVPVPQQYYEPELLVVETIDPVFDQTVTRFAAVRDQWLGRRLNLRRKASAIFHGIKGRPLLYPVDDPGAVDSLERASPFELELVGPGAACRYLPGLTAPPSDWLQNGFDDSGWQAGVTPIGYGREQLGAEVPEMQGHAVTLFLRHRFQLDGLPQGGRRYVLGVTTNGGFYAYLNGRALATANVRRPLADAPAETAVSLTRRFYELGELPGRLMVGENVLAIAAHSPAMDVAQFSVSVSLLDTEESYGMTVVPEAGEQPPFGREQYQVTALADLRAWLDTKTPLSDGEVAKLDEIGIEEYIDFLQTKIDAADDKVEFGFLRLRTDIYRVRQMMLGNEAGTKLATSPALAEIAKGQSAAATKGELADFYSRLKQPAATDDVLKSGTAAKREATSGGQTAKGKTESLFFSGELAGGTAKVVGRNDLIATKGDSSQIILTRETDLRQKTLATSLSSGELLKYATAAEVDEQNPIIGRAQQFNNVTVGERLEESSANVAHMAGVAVKGELIGELLGTGLNIDDLTIPGVKKADDAQGKTFADIRADASILQNILAGQYDPVTDDDEAGYFNGGVRAMENVAGLLRLIEGRVHAYRQAVARCKGAISTLQGDLVRIDQRLKVVGDELAEARHDVSVARSLKAEEESRISALNARRDKVLAELVPFVLFRRPRTVDVRLGAPCRFLDPDLTDMPLPLCDLSEVEAPDSLEAMLDVMRDAPLQWFSAVRLILPQLSRPADVQVTLANARQRAVSKGSVNSWLQWNLQGQDKALQDLGVVMTRSRQRIEVARRKTSAIDPASFQRLGWEESMARVPEVVSPGDLIDAGHGRLAASSLAAREMNDIARAAACLYVRFSEVPAAIRLVWAERLSQYDAPVNLRNLHTLPRFGELDVIRRTAMQRLTDWLYSRINSRFAEAAEMMSDLIRVALLAASHAPVNLLISGYLPEPVLVQVGGRFTVTVESLSRVRVGMAVSVTVANDALVRGRVVDIVGSQVVAEVHTMTGASVRMETGVRVRIGERLGMR